MLFNSLAFFVLFCVVLLGWPLVPAKYRYLFLLVVSLIFYMGWNIQYVLLMLLSIVTTYLCGRLLDATKNILKRKIVLGGCFFINLAILFFFKYFNFLSKSVDALLTAVGVPAANVSFDILLPVGISFYTFQALGYIIDVYRGDIKCERNFARYALFVSFFPQLVAGPIERSKNLLDQIQNIPNRKPYTFSQIKSGFTLMVWGYFLKMVIADRVAILVNTVYDAYWNYHAFALIVATIGFAVQIYCDFASYSTIAIGASRVLGFSLMQNFNAPYFSRSIKEFWRRWHISLSTWFRDYLYIPLGGNRKGPFRTKLNLLIVFLVSGLWHGANWTYIVWGALHGAYQVIGDLLKPIKDKIINRLRIKTTCFSFTFGQILLTFVFTCLAWIFFRAESISDAFNILKTIFTDMDPWFLFSNSIYGLGLDQQEFNILLVSLIALFAVDAIKFFFKKEFDEFLDEQNTLFQWIVIIGLIMAVIIFGVYGPSFDAQSFIYFQF